MKRELDLTAVENRAKVRRRGENDNEVLVIRTATELEPEQGRKIREQPNLAEERDQNGAEKAEDNGSNETEDTNEEVAEDKEGEDKSEDTGSRNRRTVQSTFSISSLTRSTTCNICGMCYYSQFEKDKAVHSKYHFNFENGVKWPFKAQVAHTFSVNSPKSLIKIVSIDRNSPRQVLKAEQLLDMVNKELVAPPGATFWKKHTNKSLIQGKVFVAVVGNRAIGICVMDPIVNTTEQCKWMVHRTQELVPNQVNKLIKVGVSRIWVAPKWRRKGIAAQLLNCVTSNMVYGMVLRKEEIGFSQPSFGGGLLAKSFNGVKHKSGEFLIPVYIED